jgi:site-specific DNA-adenine methylase
MLYRWDSKSILKYFGGKSGAVMRPLHEIIDNARRENCALNFVDVYGGGAHVAMNVASRHMFANVIYNEAEQSLCEFFRAVKNDEGYEIVRLLHQLFVNDKESRQCPNSKPKLDKETFNRFRALYNDVATAKEKEPEFYKVIAYYLSDLSFNGNMTTFLKGRVEKFDNRLNSLNRGLTSFRDLFEYITITCDTKILHKFKNDATSVLFCDPPYVKETRNIQKVYAFDEFNHHRFCEVCSEVTAPIIICGYDNELYEEKLVKGSGFKKVALGVNTGTSKTNSQKEEYVWIKNFTLDVWS